MVTMLVIISRNKKEPCVATIKVKTSALINSNATNMTITSGWLLTFPADGRKICSEVFRDK